MRERDIEAFLATLRADLHTSLPGRAAHARMAPRPRSGPLQPQDPRDDTRRGGVLVLFYPHQNRLWLPFILRATYHGVHSGQVSFPGGGFEPDDADLMATALREAYEEIGVAPESVQLLGLLSTLYIAPSNFLVQPVLGYTPTRPEFHLDPYEVADLIEVPVADLLDPTNVGQEARRLRDDRMADVPFFAIQGHVIWGATAMILSELLALPAMQSFSVQTRKTPQSKPST